MKKRMDSVLFALKGDMLTVANTGAEFTRKGVISVCRLSLSAKGGKDDTPMDIYNADGGHLVEAIAEKSVEKYRTDINNLIADGNAEGSTKAGYEGRFLWELLQNADDASGGAREKEQLIGSKGLGFKSVLEITEEPEIYSGEFNFHFSRGKSEEMLRKIIEDAKKAEEGRDIRVPVFGIPHAAERDDMCEQLLDEGYATVIRLPLKPGMGEQVEQKLLSLGNECLLFCQCLQRVEIRTENARRIFEIERCGRGGKRPQIMKLSAQCDEGERQITNWRIWRQEEEVDAGKRISAAVCLPMNGGRIEPCDKTHPLHVFFPTEESMEGVRALVHASCEIEDNRKRLQGGQPNERKICAALMSVTARAIKDSPPETALLAFGGAKKGDGGMPEKLANSIAQTVGDVDFVPVIGGGKVKPREVCLWDYGLGAILHPKKVRDKNLCDLRLSGNKEARAMLKALNAAELSGPKQHAELLRFCRNETMAECLAVFGVAQKLAESDGCAEALRAAPFWLAAGGYPRALSGELPLVLNKPKSFPAWLQADVLDHEFARQIKKEEMSLKDKNKEWKNHLAEKRVYPWWRKSHLFRHVLLPFLDGKQLSWWQRHGWEALKAAFEWGGNKSGEEDEPLVINSGDDKEKRARIIHLPVGARAEEWMPAYQCYAGTDWGGLRIIADFMSGVNDRGVLLPQKKWRVDVNAVNDWRMFLSWVGCSWTPKLVCGESCYARRPRMDYTAWEKEYAFEYFDDIVDEGKQRAGAGFSALLRIAPKMYKIASDHNARYYYYTSYPVESGALVQLKKNAWVRCKNSLLFPGNRLFNPEDAYMPGCGLGGLLPEIDSGDIPRKEWEDTLQELGANPDIPKDKGKLVGYMRALSECKPPAPELWHKSQNKRDKIGTAAWHLFATFGEMKTRLPGYAMVPCLRWTERGEEIYFARAQDVFWADKYYLDEAEVRRGVLSREELKVFFRFLKDGENYGLQSLSDALDFVPKFGNFLPDKTEELSGKYKERLPGLREVSGANLPEPERLMFSAFDNIALRSEKYADIEPSVLFFKKDNGVICINTGKGLWMACASAIGEVGECEAHCPDFEILLGQNTWDDFVRRLRETYRITEVFIDSLAPPPSTPVVESQPEPDEQTGETSPEIKPPSSGPGATHTHTGPVGQGRGSAPVSGKPAPVSSGEEEISDLVRTPWPVRPPIVVRPGSIGGEGESGGDNEPVESSRKDGRRAEKALCHWLQQEHPDAEVTDENGEDKNHPGYDISVKRDGITEYYECKSFVAAKPPRKVRMSARQMKEAEKHGQRYVLCVICNVNASTANIFPLIRNPAAREKSASGWDVVLPGQQD